MTEKSISLISSGQVILSSVKHIFSGWYFVSYIDVHVVLSSIYGSIFGREYLSQIFLSPVLQFQTFQVFNPLTKLIPPPTSYMYLHKANVSLQSSPSGLCFKGRNHPFLVSTNMLHMIHLWIGPRSFHIKLTNLNRYELREKHQCFRGGFFHLLCVYPVLLFGRSVNTSL